MTAESSFRGYWEMAEIVAQMKPLVEFYEKHKPGVTRVTLKRKDYDLIKRWPKTGEVHNFYVVGGEIVYRSKHENSFRDFTLVPAKGEARYHSKNAA